LFQLNTKSGTGNNHLDNEAKGQAPNSLLDPDALQQAGQAQWKGQAMANTWHKRKRKAKKKSDKNPSWAWPVNLQQRPSANGSIRQRYQMPCRSLHLKGVLPSVRNERAHDDSAIIQRPNNSSTKGSDLILAMMLDVGKII